MWTQPLPDGYWRCLWATRVLHQLRTRKAATPDSLSSLQAQLTLKWMGIGPWDSNCSGTRNNLLKKPIIRSHEWFSETSAILKKGVEPKCKWRTNTHTDKWVNPTKTSMEIPRAEKWSPQGRGGGQEKGYMGSPLWWQMEAKLWVHCSAYWNQIIILYTGNNLLKKKKKKRTYTC